MAVFASMPIPLVTLMIAFGPSQVDDYTPAFFDKYALGAGIVFFVLSFPFYWFLLRIRAVKIFYFLGSIGIIITQLLVILLSYFIHRDYFSAFFMNIAMWIVLFLYWVKNLPVFMVKPDVRKNLGHSFLVVYVLFSLWIILMGYAIATRQEPRPVESLMYNAYNTLAAFGMLLLSRDLVVSSYKTLALENGIVLIDGKPVESILGSVTTQMLAALILDNDHILRCHTFAPEAKSRAESKCDVCSLQDVKVSTCPRYRNIYNHVLDLKKFLEFTEIGSIVNPENKREVVFQGWKLLLFQNVRLRLINRRPG